MKIYSRWKIIFEKKYKQLQYSDIEGNMINKCRAMKKIKSLIMRIRLTTGSS